MALNHQQLEALEWACSKGGGWPREKANERSWVIRNYRALERRGLVLEIKEDAGTFGGRDRRLHFVATTAGRAALEKERGDG